MSQVTKGLLGGLAVVLTLGAVQLASGRDLATDAETVSSAVNRAAKADRGLVQMPRAEGKTVSVRLQGLPDTLVLIRIPGSYRQEAHDEIVKPTTGATPALRVRRTVACEPVVSVLTDVAKQLQPGRCVT
ncbi:MAG: hypothetical protein JSS22_08905 [Proteobacteria bacterium]|nr:hypothetical protein [Pseudomonadota bacterium]